MRKLMMVFIVVLWAQQSIQAQGTMIYSSSLGAASAGSLVVGSDSWLSAWFQAGTNAGGYILNSVQLGMVAATGNSSGFTVMLYDSSSIGFSPNNYLATLNRSANPSTADIYTYTSAANLVLLPNHAYCIVLVAGTTVANGSYAWSVENSLPLPPPNTPPNWNRSSLPLYSNNNGSSWQSFSSSGDVVQYAINATVVPEPGVFGLFFAGGLFIAVRRWKFKK